MACIVSGNSLFNDQMFGLPTAASPPKVSTSGGGATGDASESTIYRVLLGSCLGQKDPQWLAAGVRLTRPGRGFLSTLMTDAPRLCCGEPFGLSPSLTRFAPSR